MILATLLSFFLTCTPAAAQDQDATAPSVLDQAAPAARAAWEGMIAASLPSAGTRAPVTAFTLRADARFRAEGSQRNDIQADYRYLAPHFLSATLEGDRSTGRGPGKGQGAYWVRDGEDVIPLRGRDHKEGRQLVDELLAVARNFIALTDPSRLKLTKLETVKSPSGLPRELRVKAQKLDWIRVASTDFALVLAQTRRGDGKPVEYAVDLGLSRETKLPVLAIIREAKPRTVNGQPLPTNPLLFHLTDWRPQDGFRIPWRIHVHRLETTNRGLAFGRLPSQEIYVLEANLRPGLKEEDFEPGK